MPDLQTMIKSEIENTENSIKYYDTHIGFLSDLKNKKPELETMFDGQTFDEAIHQNNQAKNKFLKKLKILNEKLSEIENNV